MTTAPALAPTLARLTGIHVAFEAADVVCGVDLRVSAGDRIAIAGPNGAGKSTLLEVLAGTRVPRRGVREVAGAIAFVPQRAVIPPRLPVTVRDVVRVGAWGGLGLWRRMSPGARRDVDRSLARLDLAALADRPYGDLSGGQQQRALLAQGLARSAELILLDEPTTGLDVDSSRLIRAVLREESERGAAVVFVSHDAELLGDAHRIVRLSRGGIVGGVG